MVPLLHLACQLFGAKNDPPVTQITDVENSGQQDSFEEVAGESKEPSDDGSSHTPSESQRQEGIDLNGLEPGSRITRANGSVDRTPSYRILPIFSGIMIPFSLLLSIPSLTGHWYIRTLNNVIVESRPNSLLLNLSMSFSLACVVLANICIVIRFSERHIKGATFLCVVFLALENLVNIPVVIIFGVSNRFDDGFTYGQPFWMTVCATAVSTVTNITLAIDFHRISNFSKHGSGLTHKQRSLVIIIIILLAYLALGALVQTHLLKINFIDALYFSVVSIEVIGFGDITPKSYASQVFTCFYVGGGILNLALLVSTSREVLLEAAAVNLQGRIQAIRAGQRQRRVRARWRAAIKWRLQAKRLQMWVPRELVTDGGDGGEHPRHHSKKSNRPSQAWHWILQRITRKTEDPAWRSVAGSRNTRLNLEALTGAQLEAAALEAGGTLSELLPACLMPGLPGGQNSGDRDPAAAPYPDNSPRTHVRIGRMAGLVEQLALGFTFGRSDIERDFHAPITSYTDDEGSVYQPGSALHGVPFHRSMTMQDEAALVDTMEVEEKNAFRVRLALACLLFFVFWLVGSAIFAKTEGWSFATATYFCFVSFATVGYGDLSPTTPAGRSIFVVWALLGVGTMATLISILVEAYSKQYQKSIKPQPYQLKSKSVGISMETLTTTDTRRRPGSSRTIVNAYTRTDTLSPSSPIPISGLPSPPNSGGRVVFFDAPSPRMGNTEQGWSNAAAIQETDSAAAEALARQVLGHADELRALIATNLPPHGASGVYPVHKLPALFSEIEKSLQQIAVAAQDALKGTDD